MDTVSISIGLFLMGIFMMIFIAPTMNTKKRHKKMIAALNALAGRSNSIIKRKEIIGDVIVGLDEELGILYYYKHNNLNDSSSSVHLKNIIQCKLFQQKKQIKSNNENFNPFEKIGLEFVSKEKHNPNVVWEFYNIEDTSQLNFDVKLLEKWETLMNSGITKTGS